VNSPRVQPSRLARRLGTGDAVVVGLGAMIGAGVFAAFAPAARAAGNALLAGLAVAAVVAYCNATSTARLAAAYPESGGAYVYGRERLGSFWGFVAGWAFVVGKLSSCAAMARTFGNHVAPGAARLFAVAAVMGLTAVNYAGVKKTAILTRILVAFVLAVLGVVVAAVWLGGGADVGRVWPLEDATPYGVLQSAAFLFFAFAGYARIATLGEEVIDPARTIPRAIPIALGITLAVYLGVALSVLAGAGASAVASSPAPLARAVEGGTLRGVAPLVRAGAAVASLSVLLSLLVGVSRTAFAMAAKGDLPGFLGAVHPERRVPHHAELAAGAVVSVVTALADVRAAVGFSSFAVLTYYAVANAAAWTLPVTARAGRVVPVAGLLGCGALAFALPLSSVVAGAALLGAGALAYVLRRR
jgi:APA family basic amino acid/polyamine antiporter